VASGDLRTAIGTNIAVARRRKGWGQDELAKAVGSTKGQISDWENGRNLIRLEALAAIAQALGTSIDALVIGDEAFAAQVARQAVAEAKKEFAKELKELHRKVDELADRRS
jgi:transcriptional regulator with XRE-family HTH domain